MRAVVIRVSRASITINGEAGGSMDKGFVVLVGVKPEDTTAEAAYLAKKCAEMRVFEDENGKMNKSLSDVGGSMMVVSNFTLYADCRKGNRPSFTGAARPEIANPLYEYFMECLRELGVSKVASGEFGADMQVRLLNDGPVTIVLDTAQLPVK